MRVWSPDQLRAFLEHVRDDHLYAFWLLVASTGMRRGELAGLRWADVDLEAGRLSVRQPRVVVANLPQASEPKTARKSLRGKVRQQRDDVQKRGLFVLRAHFRFHHTTLPCSPCAPSDYLGQRP